ncbi:MAG: aggregation factor core [Pseudomonadota bacterium]
MNGLRYSALLAAILLSSGKAYSANTETNLLVTFTESAPKDSFMITNIGNCRINQLQLRIDLASSKGSLIFDPTGSGAGVQVFQPLKVTAGQSYITALSEVSDGSQELELRLNSLVAGAKVSLTVDLDDTLPRERSDLGQTRISDAEISGAMVYSRVDSGAPVKAAFGADAIALLRGIPCS